MCAALVWAAAVSLLSLASVASAETVEVWKPTYWMIGTWKGTTTGANGPVKVKRTFASSATNHHLEISETGGGRSRAPWGTLNLDPQRQQLVLQRLAADGAVSELVFDGAASADGRLVFASPASSGPRMRITFERTGSKGFFERIEHATSGDSFALVSETLFERTDR